MANKKNTKTVKKTAPKKEVEEKKKEVKEVEKVEEKKTSKKSNLVTLAIISVCLVAFIVGSFFLPGKEIEKKEKEEGPSVTEWAEKVKTEEALTVIASTTCPHCQAYKPVITKLAEEYGFNLYFFELEELSDDDQSVLVHTFDLENFDGGVPYSFIVRDGKFVTDAVGYSDEDSVVDFLKKNKLIK